jgi:hypothetical protein
MSDNRDYYTTRSDEESERASAATNPKAAAAHRGMADRYATLADAQPNIRIVDSSHPTGGTRSGSSTEKKCLGQRPTQDSPMVDDCLDFTRKCDQELAFADSAPTRDTLVGHLEQALRYAQLAARGQPTVKAVAPQWVPNASAAEPPRMEK